QPWAATGGFGGRGEPGAAEGRRELRRLARVRFSTYSNYWIKQSIRRAVINQGKPVRVPANAVALLTKWRRTAAALSERLGREPTPEEVGRALRHTVKRIQIAVEAIRAEQESVRPAAAYADDPFDDIAAPSGRHGSVAEGLIERENLSQLTDLIDRRGDREAAVIRHRFGLEAGVPMTLREVGERFGRTRSRVRQIEKRALQALWPAAIRAR
ncbi:MAG TPA: sigma-70 family RNA polymerase sigma factor, partial [Isosphaeraceae bacterium]